MKINIFLILGLMLSPLWATAQYLEEIGSLENVYDARARAVLNTFLRPTDYTVVIAIDLDRDEKKLKEFQDEVEVQYLPGMPMMGDVPALPKAMNKLHEMKARLDVSVVLSRNVSPEVEKVIKDVLVAKLHLDTAAGDSINVKRIQLPSDPLPPEPKPDTLPELTWKMWTLIVILSLLALSGLMFWAWRRGKAKEAAKEIKENHDYKYGPEKEEEKEKKPEKAPEVAAALVAAPPEPASEVPDFNLESVRQHILTIAGQYPQMISRAITDYCLHVSAENTANLMDFIGWDTSKRIFSEVPAMAWARIGHTVKERTEEVPKPQIEKSVREAYRALLASYIEHEMSEDETNPFSFMLKMKLEERQQILDKEGPANIAIFCLHAPPEVTADIIANLEPEKRVKVLSELSRIEKLPHNVVQAVIQSFNQKLTEMRVRPEPKIEGASVLAKVIRGMSPEEEMDIISLFGADNPEELERVRRSMLLFDDIKLVPQDIVGEVLGGYEVESLYAALFKCSPAVINHVLSVLPERKAMVVERELSDMIAIPQRKVTGQYRREISQKIEAILTTRSIRVADLVDGTVKAVKTG